MNMPIKDESFNEFINKHQSDYRKKFSYPSCAPKGESKQLVESLRMRLRLGVAEDPYCGGARWLYVL